MTQLIDPRLGDVEDDASSTKRRSLLAMAGSLLAEISLPRLILSWVFLILFPALLLGLPASRWIGTIEDLTSLHRLLAPALANAAVLLGGYLAAAALVWGIADSTMPQPRDLLELDQPPADGKIWRVVHLSDLHIVGERYGFRIESGRSGARGNQRLSRVLERLEEEHKHRPVDIVLVTGDVTDAGRSAEWAEFLGALAEFPQ